MDFLASKPQFNSLSLPDLLKARDQFHAHLMHKANVVGTAVGRYLIRKSDPYPDPKQPQTKATSSRKPKKLPRTLETSEVRDYSWPCVLVFVSTWVDEDQFGGESELAAASYIPKTIYLEDGRSVPICVVQAPLVESAPRPVDPADLKFSSLQLAGGYPVFIQVQGAPHVASIGCLVTDGHTIYALTNRHVAGEPGEELFTILDGKPLVIGVSSEKQLGRLPFETIYETWPGKHVYVNVDVGLIELEDQTRWSPSIHGVGQLGPLADLSIYNLTLNLVGCPVRAYGCVSGNLSGKISALFYRYKSVGGLEYVADFLIGSRDEEPLLTHPGDSGSVWVVDSEDFRRELMPIAIQWGGTVFSAGTANFPFALATNLSTVCRELEVDLFRSRSLASFDYWEALGHYTIGSFACAEVTKPKLKKLMQANRPRISFDPSKLGTKEMDVSAPGFVQLADVPDKVWKTAQTDKTPYGRKGPENPNHYADMDFSPGGVASLGQLTPTAASLKTGIWRSYYDSIGWKSVSQRGLLPFRVWQIYKKMVELVTQSDVHGFVAAAGVLAHYVGDFCQPLHGSYLDDGDPFRTKDGTPVTQALGHGKGFGGGVHQAYEGTMLDDNVDALLNQLPGILQGGHQMNLVTGGQQAGFAAIELMRRTHQTLDPKAIVNTYGNLVKDHNTKQASTVLWNQFGNATLGAIADGCRTLAMIWESAWVEGGGEGIVDSKIVAVEEGALRTLYEGQGFLPSKPLDQIDPFL